MPDLLILFPLSGNCATFLFQSVEIITRPSATMNNICTKLKQNVIDAGICTGCGACVGVDSTGQSQMIDTPWGPIPSFETMTSDLPEPAWDACPGKGIAYPSLYQKHYGVLPQNWLCGPVQKIRIGHANNADVRLNSSSGGIITSTLMYLLEQKKIDAAIVVKQGATPGRAEARPSINSMPNRESCERRSTPEKARVTIADTPEEIQAASQSVYIPVSVLDILRDLDSSKTYAITCLPDQSAALRVLQQAGYQPALYVKYVLGPYTGTSLYPSAIRSYLRSNRIAPDDTIESLKWRAGEWPGYLEIRMASGKVLRANKFYYNYLIPFFVTQSSLQSMDFMNEFADLSVGDAWSPSYEKQGGGFSVFATRSEKMESIISEMTAEHLLTAEEQDRDTSLEMHGHMLDFKKRGSYIRNRLRRFFGKKAPNYHMTPTPLSIGRWIVECMIMGIFVLARTGFSRWLVGHIPESIIGPFFNQLRKSWKAMSKPTKRKGLKHLSMTCNEQD